METYPCMNMLSLLNSIDIEYCQYLYAFLKSDSYDIKKNTTSHLVDILHSESSAHVKAYSRNCANTAFQTLRTLRMKWWWARRRDHLLSHVVILFVVKKESVDMTYFGFSTDIL